MRKIASLSLAGALALALGGCWAADGINQVTAALTSPQAAQAAANAKALNLAVTCSLASIDAALVTVNDAAFGAVSATPALAKAIGSKVATGAQVVNGVISVAYVVNATACKSLGGIPAAAPTP